MNPHWTGWLSLLLIALTGCASVDLRAGFGDVDAAVADRYGAKLHWNGGTELDEQATALLRALLNKKLTADDAVRIALLNSRDLQALYAELGIAQADLVQAGLFRNPILDAAVLFPLSGVRPDLQLTVVISFLDALYVPLRKRVAAARFEEAKLRVTGAVFDFAAQVRSAFYQHQANEQMLELRQTIVHALTASLDVSRRLREAGNITDLDLARDRVLTESSRLALRAAEVNVRESREQLNGLMGTWGADTAWETDGRLPTIPPPARERASVEPAALDRSVDLAAARQRIIAAGQQLGYDRATALVPSLELGGEAEREEGWKVGPVVSIPIPLFDQGQARVGRAVSELRRAQQEYYALAVRIRAMVRALDERLLGMHDRAVYYRDILLPLHEQIVNEAQLQYNAMQIGVIQLLRDRERQIETGVAYIEALRDYWLASTELTPILGGRLPGVREGRTGGTGAKAPAKEGGNGH